MTMTAAKFRREAGGRRVGRERGARRYPDDMRAFAVTHASSVRGAGGSIHSAALELGISEVTLRSWLDAAGKTVKLREVRVVPTSLAPGAAAVPETVAVTAPSGHVVSGLSVRQAAELLRALS